MTVPGTKLALVGRMARIGIVYASTHGQTAAVAAKLADHLRRCGHVVELGNVLTGAVPPPEDYDVMVIGSRVQHERHAAEISEYVREHRATLAEIPSFFYSVSMSAAEPGAGPDPRGYIARFCRDAGWEPQQRAAFAGALRYSQYDWFLRMFMRLLSGRARATDTSRDYEFTDWAAVARFASSIDAAAEPAVATEALDDRSRSWCTRDPAGADDTRRR